MSAPVEAGSSPSTVPQSLVLDFLGLHMLGRAQAARKAGQPVATQVFLTVLGALGVSDSATRTTLNRMVARGLLIRHKQGRTSAFGPTEDAMALLRRGRARMFSPTPFDHVEDIWTILNCPVPESLRNVRYQLHGRLSWAGFGTVQANLWIAPGRIDVEELLDDIFPAEALGLVQAFHGAPTGPSSPGQLLHAAWDLEALRAAHLGFLARWEAADPRAAEALPQLLLLLDDWGRLLRTDPGLPAAYLEEDWPAERSARTFQRLEACLGPLADEQLQQLMDAEG
ncbi:PaaX family transcriptional regulator [Streptomyces flaveus]|uniref:PaaX family transcriptional regulator n=1 Tax=Streptomyces flaveus TaxID=66370 RepID=UPI00332D78D9